MARKKPVKAPPSIRQRGKRASVFAEKVRVLRSLTDRFDAKKLDSIYTAKPRTAKGKAARSAAIKKVSAQFARVKLFLHKPHKVIRVRPGKAAKKNLEELRKYSGFVKLKGLRGVPVETYLPKKTRVTFDKAHRPTIVMGYSKQKFFRLDHMPVNGDDLIAQVEALIPQLPQGVYSLVTRHHFLMGGASVFAERDALLEEVRAFVETYTQRGAAMIQLIYGLMWTVGSGERLLKRRRLMLNERDRRKLLVRDIKNERAARAIALMNKQMTGKGLPRTLADKQRELRIAKLMLDDPELSKRDKKKWTKRVRETTKNLRVKKK